MDGITLRTWEGLVAHAAQHGWTKGAFYTKISEYGMQYLMPAPFNSEELVSVNLSPSPRNGQDVYMSAITGNVSAIWNHAQVSSHPCISPPGCASHEQVSLSQEEDMENASGISEEQALITTIFKTLPHRPKVNPVFAKVSTSAPDTSASIVKDIAAKIKESTLPPATIAPQNARKRKAADNDASGSVSAFKRQMSTDKAKPCGRPLVWSNRRQELCETVSYYNSYEASWCHPKGNAISMLISEDQSPRSYAEIDVVITRATGGMTEDPKRKGFRIQNKSHIDADLTVRAVKNAKLSGQAIILIGSSKCEMPVLMPHNFQVLEHYWITDTWWEKINGFNVFKYRFERCDLSIQPWYMPSNKDFRAPDFSVTCNVGVCKKCGIEQPQVYQVWLCLNHLCDAFWKLPNGKDVGKMSLEFNSAFVSKRSHFTGMKNFDIQPETFQPANHQALQFAFSRDGWLGFWCNQCGKCCSREDWVGWTCTCGNTYRISAPVLRAEETDVSFNENSQLIPLSPKSVTSKITAQSDMIGKYKVDYYPVMENQWIIHLHSTPEINAQTNGPDQLFKEMQEARGMRLLRRINGKVATNAPTAALTRHFAENYGLHYNYIVAQGSTPFSSAPAPVCHALQRLIWAGTATEMMDISKPFNELLVVGYMSDGRMGYHDDGEVSLGPTISTLSLGCQALMKFRYKKKYYSPPLDMKSNKFVSESFVLSGVPLEQERNDQVKWEKSHPNATLAEKRTHFKGLPGVKKQADSKLMHRDSLQLLLSHGDMVIMHGADIQKYMEHQVEARGCLRFALTSRHVLPHMVNPADLYMGDVDLSAYPEYDGSKDCMPAEEKDS